MRSTRVAVLSLTALLVLCFGLAAYLDVWFGTWAGNRTQSGDMLTVLMGDGQRMFANHFFVKADSYFHSGFYPTVFDNRQAFATPHVAADSGTVEEKNEGDEIGFLGPPRDWIDSFSRHFFPSRHTHLDEGGARGGQVKGTDLGESSEVGEMLPWLELSAELNPNDIRVYTVAAYWLRERMGKTAEAEAFLRQGLRANPGSYEIYYELGRVYAENQHDPVRARNLWEAALMFWHRQEDAKTEPDKFLYNEIVAHLAKLEEQSGNYPKALQYYELWKVKAPHPELVQKLIDDLMALMNAGTPPATTSTNSSPQP